MPVQAALALRHLHTARQARGLVGIGDAGRSPYRAHPPGAIETGRAVADATIEARLVTAGAKSLPALKLARKARRPFLLLPQLALGASGLQLVVALRRLQLINCLEEFVNLVPQTAGILAQLGRLLVFAINLSLEVLNRPVNVARRPLRLGALVFLRL